MKKGPNLPRMFICKKYFLKFVSKCTYIEFQISRIIFSKYFYQQSKQLFDKSETSLAKQFFLNFHCFFFTRITRMSWNISKLHHNCQNAKKLPEFTWLRQNKHSFRGQFANKKLLNFSGQLTIFVCYQN